MQTNKAYYPKVGGIETTITTLSEGLVKNFNAEVTALVFNAKKSFTTTDKSIQGVKVKYLANYGSIASLPISLSYFNSILKLKGDILHIHEPFPWADLALHYLPRIRRNFSGIIVSWHSDIIRQKWVLTFYKKHIYSLLDIADRIVVSNDRLVNNSSFLPYYKNKCTVIPIGTNIRWAKNDDNSSFIDRTNSKKSILFVGRLVYYKGIDHLIKAMSFIKDANLIIVGSGPLKSKIIEQIKNINLQDRIFIIPEVDEKLLQMYFKNCDLFVLPSVEKSETYGIVQIEAMACGKPVICTELGTGTSFINQNGVTGLVIPPRDANSLAEAINKLLSDDNLRLTLGNNAKNRAFNEFTSEKMVERMYNLYKEILSH